MDRESSFHLPSRLPEFLELELHDLQVALTSPEFDGDAAMIVRLAIAFEVLWSILGYERDDHSDVFAAWAAGRSLPVADAVAEVLAATGKLAELPVVAAAMAAAVQAEMIVPARLGLTPRELQVLQLIAAGNCNQAIADTLFLSLSTVKGHISNLLAKLEVDSRTAAIAEAHRHGLL